MSLDIYDVNKQFNLYDWMNFVYLNSWIEKVFNFADQKLCHSWIPGIDDYHDCQSDTNWRPVEDVIKLFSSSQRNKLDQGTLWGEVSLYSWPVWPVWISLFLQIKTKIFSCHTADSKSVKQEVNSTMILPTLVFPG